MVSRRLGVGRTVTDISNPLTTCRGPPGFPFGDSTRLRCELRASQNPAARSSAGGQPELSQHASQRRSAGAHLAEDELGGVHSARSVVQAGRGELDHAVGIEQNRTDLRQGRAVQRFSPSRKRRIQAPRRAWSFGRSSSAIAAFARSPSCVRPNAS